MNIENIMLSEINQAHKYKCYTIFFMCEILKVEFIET